MKQIQQTRVPMDGAMAAAYAMRQARPNVVAAYPITPQTKIMEYFSEYVSNGEVDTEFLAVESEHSAMSACIGAAAAGGRTMTGTAGPGLAFMWELLYIASSMRLPIVMEVANRSLSAPINIHCDHSDSMGARDAGWIQIFSENPQQVYDNTIQAVRIAEDPSVRLPVMVMQDGFIVTHSLEPVDILDEGTATSFTGAYKKSHSLLDVDEPVIFGPYDAPDFYFEHKRQQAEALRRSKRTIFHVIKKFQEISGRRQEIVDCFNFDDCELAIVALGSSAGTARAFARHVEKQNGSKIGVASIRVFRPFPNEEVVSALRGLKAVAVLDRSESFGAYGAPLFTEVRSALYGQKDALKVLDYVYGLGGRGLIPKDLQKVLSDLREVAKTGVVKSEVNYLGVRE